MRKPPSLPRVFAVIGAAVFIVAAATVGWVQHERSVAQMQQAAEEHNAALTTALANALEQELAEALSSADRLAPAQIALLHDKIRKAVRGTRVAKVKIYNKAGLTIFSTDPKQIGEDKSGNPGFVAALGGRPASSLTFRDRFDAFDGVISERDLLFSYIPLDGPTGIRGVFEIYTDVTHFKHEIDRTLVAQLVVLGLAFGTVFLLLLVTVVHGSRAVEREHQANLRLAADVARAEAASRSKSEFLMHLSHELRTPLNAIIGFSEIIKGQHFGPLQPPQYAAYVSDIHSAGVRLLDRINDFLELARVQVGRIKLATSEVRVADAVRDVVAELQATIEMADVSVKVDAAPGLPMLLTDPRRVRQLLFNIVENGVKFTPAGGSVLVRARAQADRLEIVVADTGIGMGEAEVSRSVIPFGGAEALLARKSEGSGLGLPLSRAIVDMLDGTMDIESAPGRGTTVRITLPAQPAATAALAA